ncbi:hypothetical protein EU546_05465 [Candidatus Thorarchaeota archaeon]|nr:MAG: hypothetical protein EU546_05465 [Candidatus Thorarchaeota archaeon]
METIFDDRSLVLRFDDAVILLVADLHLGLHEALHQEKGVAFPPQDKSILKRIKTLIRSHKAERLYILGDVKHEILVDHAYNWERIPHFMEELARVISVSVIPGNHDGGISALLPRDIEMLDVKGHLIADGRVGLIHGHAWPSPRVLDAALIVCGHTHPGVRRLRSADVPDIVRPRRIRYAGTIPVFLQSNLDCDCVRENIGILPLGEESKTTLLTMPSFNILVSGGGIDGKGHEMQGPLFRSGCVDVAESEVYSIDGLFLGTAKTITEQLNEMIK